MSDGLLEESTGYVDAPPRMGFFTDTSVCIGCKACEVACKEWNAIPDDGLSMLGMSYDNTGMLGADTWRHVAFIEQDKPLGRQNNAVLPMPTGPTSTRASAAVVDAGLGEAHGAELAPTPEASIRARCPAVRCPRRSVRTGARSCAG